MISNGYSLKVLNESLKVGKVGDVRWVHEYTFLLGVNIGNLHTERYTAPLRHRPVGGGVAP